MVLFRRPHVCSSQDHVIVEVNLEDLRALSSYDAFTEALAVELSQIYGEGTRFEEVLYSTTSDPTLFASALNAKIFDALKNYDEGQALHTVLESEYNTAAQELESFEAQADPTARRTKKEREEEAERRARVRALKNQSSMKSYEVQCLEKQLANLFKIQAVRAQLK